MPFEAGLSTEGFRHDIESEMRLAAGPMARMAFMPMRFVDDAQALRRESLRQLLCDEVGGAHAGPLKARAGRRQRAAAKQAFGICQCLAVGGIRSA